MKHLACPLPLLFLSLTLGWATSPAHAQHPAPAANGCPIPELSKLDEGNPQSELMRGRCLIQLEHFPGEVKNGRIASSSVQAQPLDSKERFLFQFTFLQEHETPTGKVPLYQVTYKGKNVCEGEEYDPRGVQKAHTAPPSGIAVLVPGYWDKVEGSWHPSLKGTQTPVFSVSCMSGAIAKCIHWGYVPWHTFKGQSLGKYHQACVKAARATYDPTLSKSYTCQGTYIDIYDRLGIKKKENRDALGFESLWNEKGVVCMTRPRWKHCKEDLPYDLALATNSQCKEPVLQPNGTWPTNSAPGALIAIRSELDNDAEACPNHHGAKCR